MSIKSTLKRLENQTAKSGNKSISFIIPYCRDKNEEEAIKQRLLKEYGVSKDVLSVFVIDFALAA